MGLKLITKNYVSNDNHELIKSNVKKMLNLPNGFYALHVKPSIVQTLVDGDEISVEELGKVETVDNKTLGRVEVGGTYGFAEKWSAYGWSNYTFGSDYDAVSLGLGLNYAW